MEKLTSFAPAYDKRSKDPKKNYGIGAVRCFMVLKGKKGAVHFVFSTGMLLDKTLDEYARDGSLNPTKMEHSDSYFILTRPMGWDVGVHSLKPLFKGQEINHPTKIVKTGDKLSDYTFEKIGKAPPNCEWLGEPCYCDGSAMLAEEWMKVFLNKGSDKIWEMLEERYKEEFGKLI